MKRMHFFVIAGVVLSALAVALSRPLIAAEPPETSAAAVDSKSGDGALFIAFVPVLRHPRCMNCHSKGDYPRQGDDSHRHTMLVKRGPAGFGVTAVKCSTCHQDHNLWDAHLPPGAPEWHLPSPSMPMIWEGLTDAQLCQSIKDPKQNKGRNIDQLVEHLTEDKLVAWGWNPGPRRNAVPIPHDDFSAKVKQWQAAGAPCPAR
ncbi:MAG: hypothetical protein JWQ87_1496 [Candidatus Sulfotelmatobacter sp.]|nr:hypothetical protein [Candidatus Sulfotelmatobacter sp.]